MTDEKRFNTNFDFSGDWNRVWFSSKRIFRNKNTTDGRLRENSDRKQKNLFANIGYALKDIWEIGLVANKIRGEFGKPPITINDKTDPFASSPKYERIDNYDGFSGQISMNCNLPGPFGMRCWTSGKHITGI